MHDSILVRTRIHHTPLLDHLLDHRAADADQIGQHAVDHHGVELLAGFEAADRVGAVDRRRGVDGGADQRFFEREVHAEAGERHHERHRGRKPAAGIDIGRERDRDALLDQHSGGRKAPELEEERRRRQQRRHHVAIGQHARVRFVDEDQVVGRARADFRGNPRAAAQRQLVGVNARLQSVTQARPREWRATRPA